MQTFTGYQYLQIDVANQYGLDKELFETRLQWVQGNMDQLESLMDQADEPILYIKAVMALRDAQNRIPTGHMMGFDACASGLQIMGAVMGCETTALNTGLIDPAVRADIYQINTDEMNRLLADQGIEVTPTRKEVKYAQMPHYYGSAAEPRKIFGEDTPELAAFYKSQWKIAPGASDLMELLLGAWNEAALAHSWTLPDGFHVRCKNMVTIAPSIEVDELGGSRFTHQYQINMSTADAGEKPSVSLAGNVIHSLDGMVVRELGRRCNYDPEQLQEVLTLIELRLLGQDEAITDTTRFLSLVEVEYLNGETIMAYSTNDLFRLKALIQRTLSYRSFPVICVHDEFKSSPNHMNRLRQTYIDILAELAESNVIQDILREITGIQDGTVKKYSSNLAEKIRGSNYALS